MAHIAEQVTTYLYVDLHVLFGVLLVLPNDVKRHMGAVLRDGQKFWELLWHVARPDSTWKPGDTTL